ncbi:hypothetical protein HK405_005328, partial [Cladochytrium tenue]
MADVPTIHAFIRALAVYEKLEHEHVGTIDDLRRTLFPDAAADAVTAALPAHRRPPPPPRVVIASAPGRGDVGFALYFFNFSTFLAK